MSEPRILIAEDDPAFRRVIEFTLRRAGWQTVAVNNGLRARELLQDEAFHWLITDHQMPGMSGLELIEYIRQELPCGEDIEIVLCTAKGLELDASGLQDRFRLLHVMHKPFSPRELVSILEQSKSIV